MTRLGQVLQIEPLRKDPHGIGLTSFKYVIVLDSSTTAQEKYGRDAGGQKCKVWTTEVSIY
jgi:hypothetical protein